MSQTAGRSLLIFRFFETAKIQKTDKMAHELLKSKRDFQNCGIISSFFQKFAEFFPRFLLSRTIIHNFNKKLL